MAPSPLRALAGVAPSGLPGARAVLRSGLARVFGPPPFDAAANPGDPGLFGPGSASWRVIAEPAAIVGGIRALLVQLLHPMAMAGVADHSSFRDDALGRLHRTSAYVSATTFGSTPVAFAAARSVRGIHRPVRGTTPDGRPYSADDPALLAWVSIALTSSFLATDRAYAPRPVDPATGDAFVAEQSRAAALLDPRVDVGALARNPGRLAALRAGELDLPLLRDGHLPVTADQLARRLDDFRPALAVNAQGRDALRFLLWPDLPAALRAGYLPLLAGAVASLEPGQRRLLRLGPAADLAVRPVALQTRALVAAMRLLAGTSPAAQAAARRAAA